MARGVDGMDIFIDDDDRNDFLQTLLAVKSDAAFSILAYCLMSNHFHLAVKVADVELSRIMQRVLTSYARGFNARHGRVGHLFQARYRSFHCLTDAYLIALVRYIHMNPVRARMALSPGDWPWSSYRLYANRATTPLADTSVFFGTGMPVEDYESWSTAKDDGFDPWPETGRAILLRDERKDAKSIDELAVALFPDDVAAIRSGDRARAICRMKSLVAAEAIQNGHSLTSIAAWMGCTPAAIHHLLRRNK